MRSFTCGDYAPASQIRERRSGARVQKSLPLERMSSEYIRAALGKMDETDERRLREWAKANCVAHRIERSSGDVVLYAQRPQKKASKSHKMTLRTLFQNWGGTLAVEGSEWLRLLSHADFAQATGGAQEPLQPQHPASPEQCGVPQDGAVFLSSLPNDFGEKSHALLMELRQGRVLTCAA